LLFALVPLLVLGLAVGLVPVIIGMVHDDRARRASIEHSHHFFVPALQNGGGVQSKIERGQDIVNQRLERIEDVLAQVVARMDEQEAPVRT
jgi:hypothetical protein